MTSPYVPQDLQGLELYEKDQELCRRYDGMLKRWRERYWMLGVVEIVQDCHMWELENPKKRKKDRISFIGNWLRAEKKRYEEKHEEAVADRKASEELNRRQAAREREMNAAPKDQVMEHLRRIRRNLRGGRGKP